MSTSPRRRVPEPFLASLGTTLVLARERSGLSQEELGFRSDLDRTYISGLERGVRNPTVRTLLRIAGALKTRASTLLREAEERAPRR